MGEHTILVCVKKLELHDVTTIASPFVGIMGLSGPILTAGVN